MPYRLGRSRDESGFTLVELLVVILIVGILAAIAIPSFLGQKTKAYDVSAKELARTAEVTAEIYATDHNGEYKNMVPAELQKVEPNLSSCVATPTSSCFKDSKEIEGGKGYEVVTKAAGTGDEFTVRKKGNGEVLRTCVSSKTSCAGAASGSW
jgi:type IV pilus assembly protein PilA